MDSDDLSPGSETKKRERPIAAKGRRKQCLADGFTDTDSIILSYWNAPVYNEKNYDLLTLLDSSSGRLVLGLKLGYRWAFHSMVTIRHHNGISGTYQTVYGSTDSTTNACLLTVSHPVRA